MSWVTGTSLCVVGYWHFSCCCELLTLPFVSWVYWHSPWCRELLTFPLVLWLTGTSLGVVTYWHFRGVVSYWHFPGVVSYWHFPLCREFTDTSLGVVSYWHFPWCCDLLTLPWCCELLALPFVPWHAYRSVSLCTLMYGVDKLGCHIVEPAWEFFPQRGFCPSHTSAISSHATSYFYGFGFLNH